VEGEIAGAQALGDHEMTEAQDIAVQEATEAQDTEDHAMTEAQDIAVKEMTEAQDTEDHAMTEAQDTEDPAMTEAQDIAVKEMTEALDTEDHAMTEAQDTIKVQLDSKETELQFTVEKILEQRNISQTVMNLIGKILGIIPIHFILLLEPNYLLY
jgi:hypothetical protein